MKSTITASAHILKKNRYSLVSITFLLLFNITISHAQLTVFSQSSSVQVCGTQATATVIIENQGSSSPAQTLNNIVITTDLLLPSTNPQSGITLSSTNPPTAIVQTSSSQTPLTVSSVTGSNGTYSFSFAQPVTLNGGDELILTFNFTASCSILNVPFSSADNSRLIGSSVTYTDTTNTAATLTETQPVSYSLIFPVLNLAMNSASQNITVGLNDQLVRQFTLTNSQSAGSISNFTIVIQYPSAAIAPSQPLTLTNGTNPPVTIAPATVSGTTYSYNVTSANLTALGFVGGTFAALQSITVQENINVTSCIGNNNITNYAVQWGCADPVNPICNSGNGNTAATLNQAVAVPALSTQLTSLTTTCGGGTAEVLIKNNGLTANDIATAVAPILTWSGINVVQVSIVNSTTGATTPISPLPVSGTPFNFTFTTNVDPGGLEEVNGATVYDDMGQGQTVTLLVQYTVPACSTLTSCTGTARSLSAQTQYSAICSTVIQTTNTTQLQDSETNTGTPISTGPTDMTPSLLLGPGQTFTFTPLLQTSYQLLQNPTTNNVTFTLPAGYALAVPSIATYTPFGSTTATPLTVSTPSVSSTGTTYTLTGGGINGTYSINVVLTVPLPGNLYCFEGFTNFNWALNLTTTCNNCVRPVICTTQQVFRHISPLSVCPPPGPVINSPPGCQNSVTTGSFNAQRNTFGYTQTPPDNTTGVWTSTNIPTAVNVTATTAGINKNAAYECDDVIATTTGTITSCLFLPVTRGEIHAQITYQPFVSGTTANPPPQLFSILSGSSAFTLTSGVAPFTTTTVVPVANPVPTYDATDNLWVYNFVFPANEANIPFPAGTTVITLTTTFVVNQDASLPSDLEIQEFRGAVYGASTNTTVVSWNNTDSWGTSFNIYRPVVTVTEAALSSNSNYLCDETRKLDLAATGGSDGDDFPHEFRSISHFTSITYQLPAGYAYTLGSSSIHVQMGATASTTVIADPTQTGTVASGLTLTWISNAGGKYWPLIDKQAYENDMWLQFSLTPPANCNAPNGTFVATTDYTYHDYSATCVTTNTVTTNTPDERELPAISIAAQTQVVTAETSSLSFTVNNAGNNAPDTWIAFEPSNPNTKITAVSENGVLIPSTSYGSSNNSLWVQLGTLTAGAHTFQLKMQISSSCAAACCTDGSEDAVNVYSGWSCTGYPAVPPNFPANTAFSAALIAAVNNCVITGSLPYIHSTSLLGLGAMNFFEGPQGICDQTQFSILLTSEGLAALHSINGVLTLPTGVTLLGVSGQFISATGIASPTVALTPVTVSTSPNTISVNVNSLIPLDEELLFDESIQLVFTIQPSCTYPVTTPVTFNASALSSCSNPVSSSLLSTRIPITGLESLNYISASITSANFTTLGQPSNVSVTVANSASFANTNAITVTVQLPANVTFNSTLSGLAPASITTNSTGQVITWVLPAGSIPANGSTLLQFNVNQTAPCNNGAFTMNFDNLSPSVDPTPANFTAGARTFSPNCTGNPLDGSLFSIQQANTCFPNCPPNITCNEWWNFPLSARTDHTTGSGNWLLAGNPAQAQPCVIPVTGGTNESCDEQYNTIWVKTVPVTPNTNYTFSYWVLLDDFGPYWYPYSSQFQFNNEPPIYSNIIANQTWSQVTSTWNSGSNTSVTITLIYQGRPVGSDATDDAFMGIDDISFTTGASCCPDISVTTSINALPCSTTNTTCSIQMVTSSSSANICLLGCPENAQITLTPAPGYVDESINIYIMCYGSSMNLTASGATTYSWSPSTGLNTTTGANVVVSAGEEIYTVTGVGPLSCTSSAIIDVDDFSPLVVTPNDTTINIGCSATIVGSGGGYDFSWSPTTDLAVQTNTNYQGTDNYAIATPSVTTVYTVTSTTTGYNITSGTTTTSPGVCTQTTTFTVNVLPTTGTCVASTRSLGAESPIGINSSQTKSAVDNGATINVFPNPFNGQTAITYQLSQTAVVSLEVYTVLGQQLATLVNTSQTAGDYKYIFNTNEYGNVSAIYLVKITIDGATTVKKIVDMK